MSSNTDFGTHVWSLSLIHTNMLVLVTQNACKVLKQMGLRLGGIRALKERCKGNVYLYIMLYTHFFKCIDRTFCK